MAVRIGNDWDGILEGEFNQPYFNHLQSFLDEEYRNHDVNPRRNRIYRALELTPFEDVKVVIVGQDPSFFEDQDSVTGLAFSGTMDNVPRSTMNIHRLLRSDLGYAPVSHGCLESWARQGVLLLNAILTVRQGEPLSHEGLGWKTFTDAIIRELSERKERMVFILWGAIAREKRRLINNTKHLILIAPHPNADYHDENNTGFLETRPFSAANEWLENHGVAPVDWRLPAY